MKVEFSDVKKFIVSIGLVSVALSFILPWFVLREPFEIGMTTTDIQNLTIIGKILVYYRQILGLGIGVAIPLCLSPLLLIGGGYLMWFGLQKWWNMQKILDRREIALTSQAEFTLEQMTADQKNKVTIADIQEENPDSTIQLNGPTSQLEITKYQTIENKVFTLFSDILKNKKCKIFQNGRIGNADYDMIIQFEDKTQVDIVVEVKYAKGYKGGWVSTTFAKVLLSLDIYKVALKRPVRGVIIFISPDLPNNVNRYREDIFKKSQSINSSVLAYFFTEAELEEEGSYWIKNII